MTTDRACALHRWTPWRPVAGGLLERRCPCGTVERGMLEALLAEALAEPRLGSRGRLDVLVLSTREARRGPHER